MVSLEEWCKKNNKEYLIEEWDYQKNDCLPSQVSYGSHKNVYWKCKKGHEYIKSIHNRCGGSGCSTCSGVNFQKRNKLFEEYPKFINEIDFNKNTLNDIKNITCGSGKKISWICELGHKYEQSPANKIKGKGCPVCSNNKVWMGFNDLETWCKKNGRTQILEDWDYNKNLVLPNQVSYGSSKKIWFKCHICGYEWQTVINSRTYQHSDCKMCSRRMSSSFPEQCIFYYISRYFKDAINGDRKVLDGRELDIWIPSLKFAIEYDGKKWHSDFLKDLEKDKLCKEKGIVLYRVREKGNKSLETKNSVSFEYDYEDWNTLSMIIKKILTDIGVKNGDVNILRDEYTIKENYYKKSLDSSLEKLYPELAKEWHPTKNGKITPDLVVAETHDNYYWICRNGHTYKASPKNRIRMKSGCPYCAGKKVLKGFNDLETTNPEIALDFDNTKNKRKSYEVSKGNTGFFWFRCHKCGYEFKYQLSTYVRNSGKCPICSNVKNKFKKVLKWETKELFDTLPLAAKSIDPNADEKRNTQIYKNIYNSCNGKTATAYGFHWFYVSIDKDGKVIDNIESFKIKNTDTSIVGQIKKTKNGQNATVISDKGFKNIDIKFDDGTIVNTRRQSFLLGVVRNPNYSPKLNQTKIDVMGQKMTIIGYRNNTDIDVMFDSGEIIKHTTLAKFNKGTVKNNKKKNIVGKSNTMKYGENATCIRDDGWDNIDIKFDDGSIVRHISRRTFFNGKIENPNHIYSYVGKEKMMNCGMVCKILNVFSKGDINVKFENGDIIEHTSLSKFEKGTILTNALSHNYKFITGKRKLMKCGQYATVIADRGSHDIDVQFDDGTIVYNRERANFNRGNVKPDGNILGMKKTMNNGMIATVIADNGWDDIDVQFENGIIVKHRRRDHFKKGSIKC